MKTRRTALRGFTIMELLITMMMISMVFLGAGSVYMTSLRVLRNQQNVDVSQVTVVSIEKTLGPEIAVANQATIAPGNQLNIRADYQVCNSSVSNNTPGNFADDNYWHFAFVANTLRMVCDNAAGTVVAAGAGTALISNVNTGLSSFQLVNPSGQGNATVVAIRVVTMAPSPVTTLDTRIALGAVAKR